MLFLNRTGGNNTKAVCRASEEAFAWLKAIYLFKEASKTLHGKSKEMKSKAKIAGVLQLSGNYCDKEFYCPIGYLQCE